MSGQILPLSNLQARELAGRSWKVNGETYVFKPRNPNEPGTTPWKSGSEGKAYPLLDDNGRPSAYIKFFTSDSLKRFERAQWLIAQKIADWSPQLAAAPSQWLDSRKVGRPAGISFDLTGCVAAVAPGDTWQELKYQLAEAKVKGITTELRWRLVQDLITALAIFDQVRLIHGDLSPNNLLIDRGSPQGQPVLRVIDFDAFAAPKMPGLSLAEGGTFGTEGYCPLDLVKKNSAGETAIRPYSDRRARDMLILEFLLAGAGLNPDTSPAQWKLAQLEKRYRALRNRCSDKRAQFLKCLAPPDVLSADEPTRPSSLDLAKALGIAVPKIKGPTTETTRPPAPPPPPPPPPPGPGQRSKKVARQTLPRKPSVWERQFSENQTLAIIGGTLLAIFFLNWLPMPKNSPDTTPAESAQEKAEAEAEAKAEAQTKARAAAVAALANATKDNPFSNRLGMRFVPVAGTDVLFSVWDTRVQDYQAFASATRRAWAKPTFDQGPTHPAVWVSWEDAQAFAKWLTEKERWEGTLSAVQSYRLPQDWEWSVAVGLNENLAGTPESKDGVIKDVYPWGVQWPPPHGAGNYWQSANVDDYERTSPVGSFPANAFGLHDMGGNVRQWCEDLFSSPGFERLSRGVAFYDSGKANLLSSSRYKNTPGTRDDYTGFRLVLGR